MASGMALAGVDTDALLAEIEARCVTQAERHRGDEGGRHFSLARTAVEEARMRWARGCSALNPAPRVETREQAQRLADILDPQGTNAKLREAVDELWPR